MDIQIIASRRLMFKNDEGECKLFDITISRPYMVDAVEYRCEIFSDNIIFKGIKKPFGMDSIDCLDYAIQHIDIFLSEFPEGTIFWPDGSPYRRVLSDHKLDWGHGERSLSG